MDEVECGLLMIVVVPQVLVMDQLATSIVSSCCRMQDVMSKGITCESRDYDHVTVT